MSHSIRCFDENGNWSEIYSNYIEYLHQINKSYVDRHEDLEKYNGIIEKDFSSGRIIKFETEEDKLNFILKFS